MHQLAAGHGEAGDVPATRLLVHAQLDEQARVETTASVGVTRARRGGVVVSGAGDLVLGEKTLSAVTSGRKVTFKVPRPLRPALGRRFTVRIRINATDRAGNRSSTFARLKVR